MVVFSKVFSETSLKPIDILVALYSVNSPFLTRSNGLYAPAYSIVFLSESIVIKLMSIPSLVSDSLFSNAFKIP